MTSTPGNQRALGRSLVSGRSRTDEKYRFAADYLTPQSNRLTALWGRISLLKKGRLSMRFVERLKGLARRVDIRRMVSNAGAAPATDWRTERSGRFGGYAVSGWRYNDLAIWHVKVRSMSEDNPGRSYVVSAGEFYPASVGPAEKFATLGLIAFWETDGFTAGPRRAAFLKTDPGEEHSRWSQ